MNEGVSGFMAIVIFAILLFLFLSAIAMAPAMSPLVSNSGAGTPFVLPAGTGLATLSATPAPNSVAPLANTQGANVTLVAGETRYTVQSGEWLQLIATRYNTTVDAILALNPQITDPSTITPGQEILLPPGSNTGQ